MMKNFMSPFYFLVKVIFLLTGLINIMLIFHKMFIQNESDKSISSNPITPTLLMNGRIACALILASIGLLVRRKFFYFISIISFSWVLGEYMRWWIRSYRLYNNIEEEGREKIQHLIFLTGANLWDIWILVVTVVALVLTLIVLRRDTSFSALTNFD